MSTLDLEILGYFCDETLEYLQTWERICISMEKESKTGSVDWDSLCRIAHNMKGSSRSVGLVAFGAFVHQGEDFLIALRDGKLPVQTQMVSLLLEFQMILLTWVNQLHVNPDYTPDTSDFFRRLQQGTVDQNFEPVPLTSAVQPHVPALVVPEEESVEVAPKGVAAQPTSVEPPSQKKPVTEGRRSADETVRVSASKLDQLIQMIGELSTHQAIIWYSRNAQTKEQKQILQNSMYLSKKVTKELYEQALSLRMQPLQSTFQRLERNARDLAQDLGKKVNVVVSGGEVELDKTVVERVLDPLTHIVRNSIDHGIEKTEQRLSLQKSESGSLSISAQQDVSGISIHIRDDGRGLPLDRIREKAIQKGIITPATKLSQEELYAMIFLPGFSTAEAVTDVSGRGVGMDVVMRAVEDLRGTIQISSEPGKGTRFSIQLPTSLSIVEALVISLAGLTYAVPLSDLEEIVNLGDYQFNSDQTMILVRDSVIPYQDLEDYLPSTERKAEADAKNKPVLICKSGSFRVGFGIDWVDGYQQVVVRQLKGGLSKVFGFNGATILGSGDPGLILDLKSISKRYLEDSKFQGVAA